MRLSYSNVASTLALFIAVSTGGAFAASSINGGQLVNRSVTNSKVKANSLTTGEIRNGTIQEADLSPAVRKKLGGDKPAGAGPVKYPKVVGGKCLGTGSGILGPNAGVKLPEGGAEGVYEKDHNGYWVCNVAGTTYPPVLI